MGKYFNMDYDCLTFHFKIALLSSILGPILGAVSGTISGFFLGRWSRKLDEKEERKSHLNYLLREMECNYEILDTSWKRWKSLEFSAYEIAEKDLILSNFCGELIEKIRIFYSKVRDLKEEKLPYSEETMGELQKLLKEILPKYAEELKNKNLLEKSMFSTFKNRIIEFLKKISN
ncbi:MAG: hypothetical protein ABIK66_05430 [candidate division WOR-3 bacterium]